MAGMNTFQTIKTLPKEKYFKAILQIAWPFLFKITAAFTKSHDQDGIRPPTAYSVYNLDTRSLFFLYRESRPKRRHHFRCNTRKT